MYAILKSRARSVYVLVALIIAGQLLLIYAATINALVLNELIAMNLLGFLKLSIYQLFVWNGIVFLDWKLKNTQVKVIQELDIEIRDRIARDIAQSSYQEFHSKSSGTYLSWLNNDIQTLNKQAFEQLFLVIKGVSGTVFAVITLNAYHWSLTLATFFSLLIMLLVPKLFAGKMRTVSLALTHQNESFLTSSETVLNGFDVLTSLSLLSLIPRKIKEAGILLKEVVQKKTTVETLAGAISFFLNIFFQISLVFLTGYLATQGLVKIGTIEAIGALTGVIFTSLGDLGGQLSAITGTKPIFAKLASIEPSHYPNSEEELDRTLPIYQAQNVCYHYGDKEVLHNVSLSIQQGNKYLILGESGSGKSTFLKLLTGFLRDYTGNICFYGKEMKELNPAQILSQVLYLDQRAYLFDGTVRENLALDEEFSDAELFQVLEQVGLRADDFPDLFLDYQVGQDGRLLSGGQKQRLALARGLLRNKKIILMDEGTSAVDRQTSLEIERELLENGALTLIMITHAPHPELLPYFDQIIHFPDDLIQTK